MIDKEYWKRKYRKKWKDGNRRERIAVRLFKSWGIKLIPYGFETLSKDYTKESPEEPGKPDFYADIFKKRVYFEVTGTDVPTVNEKATLWIRPDKVDYAKKHKLNTYCIHILEKLKVIRFIRMKDAAKSPFITPTIRGTEEGYYAVNPKRALSIKQFKKELRIR